MDNLKAVASRYLLSDLGVAAVLAEATARAAWYSVRINAHEMTDDATRAKLLSDISRTVEHCARHREAVEAFVRETLENRAGPCR